MAPVNVAYLFTPIEFGGAERVTLAFLKNVDRERFRITPIVLIRPWERGNVVLRELEKEGYCAVPVPVARRPRSAGRDPFRLVRCYGMIHETLRSGAFDLLHTHGYFADILGIPASRMLGIPHIATCHGFIDNDRALRLYNALDRAALRFSRRIIAVSEDIRADLVSSGIAPARVCTIGNAVPVPGLNGSFPEARRTARTSLRLGERDFVVGFAGRLSGKRGSGIWSGPAHCSKVRVSRVRPCSWARARSGRNWSGWPRPRVSGGRSCSQASGKMSKTCFPRSMSSSCRRLPKGRPWRCSRPCRQAYPWWPRQWAACLM